MTSPRIPADPDVARTAVPGRPDDVPILNFLRVLATRPSARTIWPSRPAGH